MRPLLFLLSLLSLLFFSASSWAEFRNQFACFAGCGTTEDNYVQYAKQMGYEWIVGDPWSPSKASAAKTHGLKVLYNSNTDRSAKWLQLNNPGGTAEGSEPDRIDIGSGMVPITAAMYAELDKTLCMQSYGLAMGTGAGSLYDEVNKRYKYYRYLSGNVGSSVPFVANRRGTTAIALGIFAAIRHRQNQENAAGKHLYDGIFFDESRYPTNVDRPCANPINAGEEVPYETGRTQFFAALVADFQSRLGANFGGVSSNPYYVDGWGGPSRFPSDFLMGESGGGNAECGTLSQIQASPSTGCGNQNTATFSSTPYAGNVSPTILMFQQTTSMTGNYLANQLIFGRAASSAVLGWGGWYAAPIITNAGPGVHLVKVIPNWDNISGATSRNWNESADTYTSSNSFTSTQIAWSRHHAYATNHKLFVSPQNKTGTPSLTLNSNEKVVNAKCTTSLFLETTDCKTGYFTQSGNVVTFGASVANAAGYVLYVHRQPTFLSATVSAANQLDVCHTTDDAPVAMLPVTGATGYTVLVDGVSKTPNTRDRLSSNCFRLVFPASTITSSANVVTVNYTAGNITSGTNMLDGTTKVAAANFGTPRTATNTLAGGGGGTPIMAQTGYQWQSVDGGADDALLYNTANAQLHPSSGARARLIIKMRNTVNAHAATDFPLYYVVDPADTAEPNQGVPVTNDCTQPVCFTCATGIGSKIPTTEFLTSAETTNVACGVIGSEGEMPVVTMPAASEIECIYSLKFNESLTAGQKVYFIPRKSGNTLLNAYVTSNLPHATVQTQRSDRKGSVTGGDIR